jgi:hypothetical protein
MAKHYVFKFNTRCQCSSWLGTVHWSVGDDAKPYIRKERGGAEVFTEGQPVPRIPSGGEIVDRGDWEYAFSCPDCKARLSLPIGQLVEDKHADMFK